MTPAHPERQLAEFAATVRFADVPDAVVRRTEDLFLDWAGSTLAGKGARPVEAMARFMASQGPAQGSANALSEVLIHRTRSSPLVAATLNAAASHFAEQDDVHNGSVFHPAAVVFPPALAVAQALGRSGRELLLASIVGYEVGIRVGEFLGRSHYKVFHTTGTVGTLAAAAAVGSLLRLNADQMLHALGSAGTQSAGLWEFLRDGADSKQLHTAHAAGAGLTAACLAAEGFTGAQRILGGAKGLAAGMSSDADPARLTDGLPDGLADGRLNGRVTRWATAETSFKYHAACRHTHPAADALQRVMHQHQLTAADVAQVTTQVHQGAIDVLGPVVNPQTVHQSKFSMGTVLAMVALHGRAGMAEFDAHYADPAARAFCDKVQMTLDAEVDSAYPARWIGKVIVHTTDGRQLAGRVDEPKGDPGNTLSRAELEDKAIRLAMYRGGATEAEMRALIRTVWGLADAAVVPRLLAPA